MDRPIDGIGMAMINDALDEWGVETMQRLKQEFKRKIGFGDRKYDKLQTRTYNNEENWEPKSNYTNDFVEWVLTQPAGVDEGSPKGTNVSLTDLYDWADDRNLPHGITSGKGLSRHEFLLMTRRLVFDRGVEGLNYSQIFESNEVVSNLDRKIYTVIEDIIDRQLQQWEKNYR